MTLGGKVLCMTAKKDFKFKRQKKVREGCKFLNKTKRKHCVTSCFFLAYRTVAFFFAVDFDIDPQFLNEAAFSSSYS